MRHHMRSAIAALILASVVTACSSDDEANNQTPGGDTAVDAECGLLPVIPNTYQFSVDGETYRIVDGKVYAGTDSGTALDTLFEPNYITTHYRYDDSCNVLRVDTDLNASFPVKRTLTESFAGTTNVRDIANPEHAWSSLTLLSPANPTVEDYVALQRCYLAGTCDFDDNRLDIVDADHDGKALRAFSVPKSGPIETAKASIESGLAHCIAGDDVRISAWVRVESGVPFSFIDLEASWILNAPGPRLVLIDGNKLGVELKWADKPLYTQEAATAVNFPFGSWVKLEVDYYLSAAGDGEVRVRQNDTLLIDRRGQTLPLPFAILDSFEVGISATNDTTSNTSVLVDDVSIVCTKRDQG